MDKNVLAKLDGFFDKYPTLNFKDGETIARPGEVFDHISFVHSGYVRQYVVNKSGQEITINFFKPVFFMTFIYSVLGKTNKYYFEAVGPVSLHKAPQEEFMSFVDQSPEIFREIARNIFGRLSDILDNVEHLISGDIKTRVAAQLVLLAKNFGKNDQDNQVKLTMNTTHQEISSLIGSSRESVSVQMSQFQKDGLISQSRDGLVINNLAELEKIAGL